MEKGTRYAERFTILRLAGTGGTASVYQAFDDTSGDVVALKIFGVSRKDPDVVTEFWNREVKALSSLCHKAIVRFIDAGRDTASSEKFIVLEWLEGLTLEAHLEGNKSPNWESFFRKIGADILGALVHAAGKNISHRDLSPTNVLVRTDGKTTIIDFGQAKVSSSPVGRTVAGWHTDPYCPPEADTGRYTYTRDAYSFCAIAVRALAGHQLKDHETLYDAFKKIDLPEQIRAVFASALSRDPAERFGTTIEFEAALSHEKFSESEEVQVISVPIRLLPTLAEKVTLAEEGPTSPIAALLEELNDVVAVSVAPHDAQARSPRIAIETQSYRFVIDIDSNHSDHLVIVGLVRKQFRLDSLYQEERWMPRVLFTEIISTKYSDRELASRSVRRFYEGLEGFESSLEKKKVVDPESTVAAWGRLLDALRHIAKNDVPPLRYTNLEQNGRWLTATVENPEDATEQELRTISVDGRWVFRGEVDSTKGALCTLLSKRHNVSLESIPAKGRLDIDWQQTKIALDRQARAVERFSSGEVPNPGLASMLMGHDQGPVEPSFAAVSRFFDQSLDGPKKEVVSRCAAKADLIVTHGPPGTGKTKLIVELVRQALIADPECRVLLVSQTHVALDNALERLLRADPDVSCVRIGSGSRETDPRVESCTVEKRGAALKRQVEASARSFLESKASALGVDKSQVELGLRVLDLVGLREQAESQQLHLHTLLDESETLLADASSLEGQKTRERADHILRLRVVEEDIERTRTQIEMDSAEIAVAEERLNALGKEGRGLAKASKIDLESWADLLVENDKQKALGELMRTAETWRLRFGQSDDFKAAIISSSSIVAGTCVGFCREQAASRATFDLCIVDEAGKATTTELLVPLSQSRRAVILGDHHQLPAVLDYSIHSSDIQDRFGLTPKQVEEQLFEKLINELGAGACAALTTQYRMRGSIGALVSHCFYDGELTTDQQTDDRTACDLALAGIDSEVTWLDPYSGAASNRRERAVRTSFVSDVEVQCILALLKRLVFVFQNKLGRGEWPVVAVITGYEAHANAVRAEIRKDSALDRLNVECATVHSFQGREVDICIYSVVRNNDKYKIGMLREWRHLNVALSRARDNLVIVGGLDFCRRANQPNPFQKIIEFIEESDGCEIRKWSGD